MAGYKEPDHLLTRRKLLATAGAAAGVGVAGCLGGGKSIHLLSAGSLATTFEEYVGPAFESETEIDLRGEYFGTNALIRMIEDRTTRPDVIVGADATLLRDRLSPAWDIEFATNSLGVAYNPKTAVGGALEGGNPWYSALRAADDGEVAIADPNLDPLGYRAIQAFELAEREHDLNGFREEMAESVYREPEEPQMMAGIETGSSAAAVVYRNMAVDHDVPFVEFPPAYNFAEPSLAEHYATVSYTTDEEGYTAVGRPILYNATVYEDADAPEAARELVGFLTDNPGLLTDAGLTVAGPLPVAHGMTPEGISV